MARRSAAKRARSAHLVLWRIMALFLCMFVGSLYVFRYLGTDVREQRIKEANADKRALEGERAGAEATADPEIAA